MRSAAWEYSIEHFAWPTNYNYALTEREKINLLFKNETYAEKMKYKACFM